MYKSIYLYICLTFLLIFIDLYSKHTAEQILNFSSREDFYWFIDLYLTYNSGIAFSLLDFNNFFTRYILLAIGLLVIIFLITIFFKESDRFSKVSLIFIIAGALGNFLDRAIDGLVTDFLLFHIAGNSLFIFNVADAFITIGAIIYFGCEILKLIKTRYEN